MSEENGINYGRLADFLYEAGMLKNIPRSGFPFLGSGRESVAEHSYRASVIGFVLANLAGANAEKVVCMCLFHDLHEARTGDFNYVNHRYNTSRARDALRDAVAGTGLDEMLLGFHDEFCARGSLEASLARDADQLDLLCALTTELSKGNEFAREWIDNALPRLGTEEAKKLAMAILNTAPNHWWYGNVEKEWWIHRGEKP